MWFKTHPLKQSLVPRYESSLQILGSQWQGWRNLKFLIFPNKRWHLGPFSKMHHDGGIWGIENYNHKLLFLSHGKSLDSGSRSYQLPETLGVNRVNLRKAFWGHEGIPETARASVARLIGALPDLRAGMNSFEVLGVGMGDIGWHGNMRRDCKHPISACISHEILITPFLASRLPGRLGGTRFGQRFCDLKAGHISASV